MNQREAKRLAWWLASLVLQSARDAGWPENEVVPGMIIEDDDGEPTKDGARLGVALDEVIEEMHRRGHV